jgi:excisionase family DNA binding protein
VASNQRGGNVADFITTTQAAAIIGCTDSRVRQLVRAGMIPGVVKAGPRAVLIPRRQAEKLRDHPSEVGRPRNRAG